MTETTEIGTLPKDPELDLYTREKWLRYDVCTSLREIRDMINQMPISQQQLHILQRIDGLLLRSVRVRPE